MYHAFLLKYGEIGVKGKNRYLFEEALVRDVERALKRVDGKFKVTRPNGRIYVEAEGDFDYENALDAVKSVFGLVQICPVVLLSDNGYEDLSKRVIDFIDKAYDKKDFTFKVACRRGRKDYPKDSMELAADLGGDILDAFPDLKVDVHNPDVVIHVEIRGKISLYSKVYEGLGGLPLGTSGRAMLLLSGGIDSPVAGYRIAKRGVTIDAVYFHAPPYTSERAKNKVIDLAKIISKYTGPIRLHIVNFTDIQMKILDCCPHDELTIIMRRYMMKIAEHFALEDGDMGLVTGESIGQVASQTMQSLSCTDAAVTKLPVYRPLIAWDKQEIIDESLKIGTYETSILPYQDCCTIFVAKHPVTKPKLDIIESDEQALVGQIEDLYQTAIDTTEVIRID